MTYVMTGPAWDRCREVMASTFLSTSEGAWRVIHQGLPLCADTDKDSACKVARRYGFDPGALPVWNGDKGEFTS